MKLQLGGHLFSSKAAATEAIRGVLYRYPIGATVTNPDDVALLTDLLARHPKSAAKIGCGVASFQVEQNIPSRGFWLTRCDGSRTDWSYLSCLTPPSHLQDVYAALRTEVRCQVQAFKLRAFSDGPVRCAVTGDVVTLDNAHVDHDPPFVDLVARFLVSLGLSIEHIQVEAKADGETERRLVDRELAARWSDYHYASAGLRIVTPFANLSILRTMPRARLPRRQRKAS